MEEDLECLYILKNNGSFIVDLDQHCRCLEAKHNKILLDKEESWRQKIRATWIKSGDKNNFFFIDL
jgi:hypothetical protein